MSAATRKASLGRKLDLNYIYLYILIHSPGYVWVTPRGQKFVDRNLQTFPKSPEDLKSRSRLLGISMITVVRIYSVVVCKIQWIVSSKS